MSASSVSIVLDAKSFKPKKFQDMFKNAAAGNSNPKPRKISTPSRKKPLNLVASSDADYVPLSDEKKRKEISKGELSDSDDNKKQSNKKKKRGSVEKGRVHLGYRIQSEYKDLKFEEEKISVMMKDYIHNEGFRKIGFSYSRMTEFWFNTSRKTFGFIYNDNISGIPAEEFSTGEGVCFQSSTSFSAIVFESVKSNVMAERDTFTTSFPCLIPGDDDQFNPQAFVNKAKEENSIIKVPTKTRRTKLRHSKVISDDDDEEETLFQDRNPKYKTKESKEEEEEKSHKETLGTVLSEDDDDISDSEIVKTNRVLRSQSKRSKENTDQVILTKYNINITKGDLMRLEPGQFLNDNIIDFYIA